MFPEEIKKYVVGMKYTKDTIGCSQDEVYVFEKKYILKISDDGKRLLREKEKNDWITKYIPGSRGICYFSKKNKYYYLRSCIDGDSLISKRFLDNPSLLIEVLVNVIRILRSLDDKKCPFKASTIIGDSFIHGDLCLPNIYVNNKNEFIGFIDLENAGLGDKWYDYAWLLWSLEYNLKTNKYNEILLKQLGISFDQEKYNEYIPKDL